MSLATNVTNLATRVASEAKALRTLINGNVADLSGLNTVAKANLVAAINEIVAAVGNAGASINDAGTSTSTVWSSSKTDSSIKAAVSAVVDASPTTLDTLNELAAALGDDPNFATTITTALGKRVRFDAAQTLTTSEATQARANIGAGTGNSNLVIGTTSGTAADAASTSTALAGKAPTTHTHTASQITDATTVGKSVLTAADAATARAAIGAGTGSSNLVLGTTSSTAKAGNYQPAAADISDAGATGIALIKTATAAAALTVIGAASSADMGDPNADFVATFNAGLV